MQRHARYFEPNELVKFTLVGKKELRGPFISFALATRLNGSKNMA
jgi:hypothetical protein